MSLGLFTIIFTCAALIKVGIILRKSYRQNKWKVIKTIKPALILFFAISIGLIYYGIVTL